MNYFRRLIDANDPTNIERFTVLVALSLYLVTNFIALFINKTLLNLQVIDKFTDYNFYIICVGIFGLSIEKIADIALERAKAAAAAQILTPQPTVTQVDIVEGNINGPEATTQQKRVQSDASEDLKEIKQSLTKSLKSKTKKSDIIINPNQDGN